jgi:hypothetical protein
VLNCPAGPFGARIAEYAAVDDKIPTTEGEVDGTTIVSIRIFEEAVVDLDAG